MTITAAEQLLIELTNRARLDPLGEAARYGIDLNDGLAAGTITATPKQVLAPSAILETSADGHAIWMLDNDVFSHTGADGTSPRQRMEAAGYVLSGSWATGENLAFAGTTGTLDLEAAIYQHHEGLFRSAGHRVNTMNGTFRELGVAQEEGIYTSDAVDYNTSMTALNFGRTGTSVFVTGVTYDDHDSDLFYDVGEGHGNVTFSSGEASAVSADAGGYALTLTGTGAVPVHISSGSTQIDVAVDLSKGNVKLDLLGSDMVLSSANIGLGAGGQNVTLIGIENTYALGNDAQNRMTGNAGSNTLNGNGGSDYLASGGGNDTMNGGAGNDTIRGDAGADRADGGSGNDDINTGAGDDVLMGGNGDDLLNGGDGSDTATFSGTVAAMVDLRISGAQSTGYGSDTFVAIENLGGTGFNDGLIGNEARNVLYGNAGNDTLSGLGGSDRILGGDGDDRIDGGAGHDVIEAGAGNDTIMGGANNDRIWGGTGIDTATFSGTANLTVDLSVTVAQETGQGLDLILEVENLGGGSGNDLLTGNALANALYGNAGSDTLAGGYGADTLVGGTQADTFVFRNGWGADRINDFHVAEADRLHIDDSLWGGGLSIDTMISTYASVVSGGVLFSFADGDSLLLAGVKTLDGLAAQIDLI